MPRPNAVADWEAWKNFFQLQREIDPWRDEYDVPYVFDQYGFQQIDCGRGWLRVGNVAHAAQEFQAARDWGEKAQVPAARFVQAEALIYLGDIHRRTAADRDRASKEYQDAIKLLQGLQAPHNLGIAHFRLATLAEEMNQLTGAHESYCITRELWGNLEQENGRRGNWDRHGRYKTQREEIEAHIQEVFAVPGAAPAQPAGVPGSTTPPTGGARTTSPFAAPTGGAGGASGGQPSASAVPPGSSGTPYSAPASAVTPRGPRGNYAITVICHGEKPKRSFPKPSLGFVLLLALGALGVLELIIALWLVPDRMAQIILVTMFIVTVLMFFILVVMWRFRVTIPSKSIGILLGGDKPTLLEGSSWRLPIVETLYDVVSLGRREYKCRVEFREREGSSPVIFQEIKIQYHVTRQQLDTVVSNQRFSRDEHSRHPLTSFWESQLGDHLQRYFEDMVPAEIDQAIENPHALEPKILKVLRDSANKHHWGIDFPFEDEKEAVHLGYYRIEKWQ
jgi:hypothetical protein